MPENDLSKNILKIVLAIFVIASPFVPILITKSGWIPVYQAQSPILATLTGAVCFLLLFVGIYGFQTENSWLNQELFSKKNQISNIMIILAIISMILFMVYYTSLLHSISSIQAKLNCQSTTVVPIQETKSNTSSKTTKDKSGKSETTTKTITVTPIQKITSNTSITTTKTILGTLKTTNTESKTERKTEQITEETRKIQCDNKEVFNYFKTNDTILTSLNSEDILNNTDLEKIENGFWLILFYVGMFMSAQAAFVLIVVPIVLE